MKTGSHLPALGLARFGSRFSLSVRVLGGVRSCKKDADFFSLSLVKERELHKEDLSPVTAPAFPVQATGLNPVLFTSFGIAIALVCGGVSSFFPPTDLIAIGEVKYFHYPLPQHIEIFKGIPGRRLASSPSFPYHYLRLAVHHKMSL